MLLQFGPLKDEFWQNGSFSKPRHILQHHTILVEIMKNCSQGKIYLLAFLIFNQWYIVLQIFCLFALHIIV